VIDKCLAKLPKRMRSQVDKIEDEKGDSKYQLKRGYELKLVFGSLGDTSKIYIPKKRRKSRKI
jgi:hypothetical protein